MIFTWKRLMLAVVLAIMLAALLGAQPGSFLYVNDNGRVGAFRIDDSGALAPITGSPFGSVKPINPITSIAAHPNGKFLYVVYAQNLFPFVPKRIAVFAIDPVSGSLSEVPGSPFTGDFPFGEFGDDWVTIDPTGRFAYLARYVAPFNDFRVSVYSIDSTTGAMTSVPNSLVSEQCLGFCGAVSVDPTGRFAYVHKSGYLGPHFPASILAYTINPATGTLSVVPGSPFPAPITEEANIRSIAADPRGKFVYRANGLASGVAAYSINPGTGALTQVPGSAFPEIPTPCSGTCLSSFGESPVVVDPTGRFAYLSDGQHIWAYAVDSTTGALTVISNSQPSLPASILVLDTTGRFLYRTAGITSASDRGGLLADAYAIDTATGLLAPVPGSPFTVVSARSNVSAAVVGPKPMSLIPPATTAALSPAPNSAGWNNTSTGIALVASADFLGFGVKQIEYSLDGAETGSGVASGDHASISISAEGTTTITYFATDNTGHRETPKTLKVSIDKTPPAAAASALPLPNANGWNNTDVTVSFSGTDALSGIDFCTGPITLFAEGAGQAAFGTCTDKAGNVSAPVTRSGINIDKTAPTMMFGTPIPTPNAAGWNNTNVSISFTAGDALSGASSTSASSPLVLTAEGPSLNRTVTVTDLAGNTATFISTTVKIDKTPPEAYNQFNPETKTVQIFGRDLLSGTVTAPNVGTCVAATWGDDDEDQGKQPDDKQQGDQRNQSDRHAQLCTHRISDAAGNTLLVTEKVRQQKDGGANSEDNKSREIQFRVISTQYNSGSVATAPFNQLKFDWSISENGTLTSLNQTLIVGQGKDRQEVNAAFSVKKNQTIIKVHQPEKGENDGQKPIIKSGLDLLRMATNKGELNIEF